MTGTNMQSVSSATTLYLAQYAGNGVAIIYSACDGNFVMALVLFICVMGLLMLADIL